VPDDSGPQPANANGKGVTPHPPLERDKRGWHVAPAPDGRGMPEKAPSGPPVHRRPGFLWFVLILLVINVVSSFAFHSSSSEPQITIPFNPYFLSQVQEGQVKSISTKGDTVVGSFKAKVHYPASDKNATPTKQFATEIPTFWNGSQLSAMLKEKGVLINAKSTSTSQSVLAELLLGFGPTLWIVGLFILIARRAAKAGGAMGALGTSGARRHGGLIPKKSPSRSTM
jgi:cell division protease FtsH